jgi:hypothetical protein
MYWGQSFLEAWRTKWKGFGKMTWSLERSPHLNVQVIAVECTLPQWAQLMSKVKGNVMKKMFGGSPSFRQFRVMPVTKCSSCKSEEHDFKSCVFETLKA